MRSCGDDPVAASATAGRIWGSRGHDAARGAAREPDIYVATAPASGRLGAASTQRLFEEGLADPDPWHAIVTVHERALELWPRNRRLKEIILRSTQASERGTTQRVQLHPLAAKLIELAQAAGQVRADASTQHFGVVLVMAAAVIDAAADVDLELCVCSRPESDLYKIAQGSREEARWRRAFATR